MESGAKEGFEVSGEDRLRQRKRSFWRYVAIAFLAAFVVGMVSGMLVAFHEGGWIPAWLALAAASLAAIAFAWFTRDYFRRIDELDLMDNLWAHMAGLYGGFIVFGLWYFAADMGLVEGPSAAAILGIMALLVFAAYGLRKLGMR